MKASLPSAIYQAYHGRTKIYLMVAFAPIDLGTHIGTDKTLGCNPMTRQMTFHMADINLTIKQGSPGKHFIVNEAACEVCLTIAPTGA